MRNEQISLECMADRNRWQNLEEADSEGASNEHRSGVKSHNVKPSVDFISPACEKSEVGNKEGLQLSLFGGN